MNFKEISKETTVHPGEYLLHTPSNQIVLCGAFNYDQDFIRCLNNGKLMTDTVKNFKKIQMSQNEIKKNRARCKGCNGAR